MNAKTKVKEVTDAALLCFWEHVAKSYPKIKTGDFPPGAECDLEDTAEEAITLWVGLNEPWWDDWRVGTRIIFPEAYDCYPEIDKVAKDATGTVVESIPEGLWISMDHDFKGYDAAMWRANGWPIRGIQITHDVYMDAYKGFGLPFRELGA